MATCRSATTYAAALTLVSTLLASGATAWDTNPLRSFVAKHHYQCGSHDLPEKGIQGDVPKADQVSGRAQKGYNCGLALLGFTPLNGDGRPNENANMAWAGHCAYVSDTAGVTTTPQRPQRPPPTSGVAVVSVSPKGVPHQVAVLRNPGALATSETINAVTTPTGRSILVVGQYGNDAISKPKPMDVYDISNPDCRKFRHLPNPQFPHDPKKATFYWPENIHNLTLSRDGRYVFATLPLQVADISRLWDHNPHTGVKYLGDVEKAMEGPTLAVGPTTDIYRKLPDPARRLTHPMDSAHEAWPSPDAKTLYLGAQTPQYEIFSIVDISKWLARTRDGKPKGSPRVISQMSGRGHSVRTAVIQGTPYVLHSDESVFGTAYGCIPQEAAPFAGPAQPWLTDISDPAHPKTVVQFGLQINEPSNCLTQRKDGENDSVHYHDVDDPADTTFVMASMWNAGIRIFDVRNPTAPTEVGYFNPGDVDPTSGVQLDQAWGHIRYVARTGQIWFATAYGGFWVVRIEGKLRNYLRLDAANRRHDLPALDVRTDDPGRPGTVAAQGRLVLPVAGYVDLSRYYCTLGAAAAAAAMVHRGGAG